MDISHLTVEELAEKCMDLLEICSTQGDEALHVRFQHRVANFRLWCDGVGALAKKHALDWRFRDQPDDLTFVKGILALFQRFLETYRKSAERGEPVDEPLRNIDSILEDLALLSLAVRQTGKTRRSQLEKADSKFNFGDHEDLWIHMQCLLFIRRDPAGLTASCLDHRQHRLLEANLRRRNRFLQAQKGSSYMKQPADSQAQTATTSGSQAADETGGSPTSRGYVSLQSTALEVKPLASGASGHSASVTEDENLHRRPPRRGSSATEMAATMITGITASATYPYVRVPEGQHSFMCPCCCQPLPREYAKSDSIWRKHLAQDIQPYTCIADDCPTAHTYYSTEADLARHLKAQHRQTWQCPLCDQPPVILKNKEGMREHFLNEHRNLDLDEIPGLLLMSLQYGLGIAACPVCGESDNMDSPELITHALDHMHQFSLLSLPWSEEELDISLGDMWFNPTHYLLFWSPRTNEWDQDKGLEAATVRSRLVPWLESDAVDISKDSADSVKSLEKVNREENPQTPDYFSEMNHVYFTDLITTASVRTGSASIESFHAGEAGTSRTVAKRSMALRTHHPPRISFLVWCALAGVRTCYPPLQTADADNADPDGLLAELGFADPREQMLRVETALGGNPDDRIQWLMDNSSFLQWRDDTNNRLLWIQRDTSQGKTRLLYDISNELQLSLDDALVLFLPYQATEDIHAGTTEMMRGLIYLFVKQRPSLCLHLERERNQSGRAAFQGPNAISVLSQLLGAILADPILPITYVVLDMFGEPDKDFHKCLNILAQKATPPRIKWVIAGRWKDELDDLSTVDSLLIDMSEESQKDSHSVAAGVPENAKKDIKASNVVKDVDESMVSSLLHEHNSPSQPRIIEESTGKRLLDFHDDDYICVECGKVDWDSLVTRGEDMQSGDTPLIWRAIQKHEQLATSSCKICRILSVVQPESLDGTKCVVVSRSFLDFSGTYAIPHPWPECKITALHICRRDKTDREDICHEKCLAVIRRDRPDSSSRMITPRLIDYEWLKRLVQSCRENHEESCRPNSLGPVYGLKVIEASSRTVIEAPAECKYVALSCVWGKQPDVTQTKTSDLQNLPLMIEDVLSVTIAMGFKYLWIERYCIPHTDSQERHRMIYRLGQVYANASLTIIVASKEDVHSGLPGVSGFRRPQRCVYTRNAAILEVPCGERELNCSKWATRGSTFKEDYLSNRRLVFTSSQTLFLCNGSYAEESLCRLSQQVVTESSTTKFSHLINSKMSWEGEDSAKLLQEHSIKSASNSSNSLLGILNFVKDQSRKLFSPFPHVSLGLLAQREGSEAFLRAYLNWYHETPAQRRPDFPTWSWAGWVGSLKFDKVMKGVTLHKPGHGSQILCQLYWEISWNSRGNRSMTLREYDNWSMSDAHNKLHLHRQPDYPKRLEVTCFVVPICFQTVSLTETERNQATEIRFEMLRKRTRVGRRGLPFENVPVLQFSQGVHIATTAYLDQDIQLQDCIIGLIHAEESSCHISIGCLLARRLTQSVYERVGAIPRLLYHFFGSYYNYFRFPQSAFLDDHGGILSVVKVSATQEPLLFGGVGERRTISLV